MNRNFLHKLKIAFLKLFGLDSFLSNFDNLVSAVNAFTKNQKYYSLIFNDDGVWLVLSDSTKIKYSNKMNSVSSIILRQKKFENTEMDFLYKNLKNDGIVLDVGANVGFYSMSILKRFDRIYSHAFEPVADTIKELSLNAIANNVQDRIRINQYAVTERTMDVMMTTAFHSSNYITTLESKQNKIKIQGISIDEYCRTNGISTIQFIKIDVEGRELSVLKGAKGILTQCSPLLLVELIDKPCEFNDRVVENHLECIELLHGLGYEYHVVDDDDRIFGMKEISKANLGNIYHNYIFHNPNKNEITL